MFKRYRRRGRSRGQAVVEFTLVLPILLLLVLGIGDFARLFTTALTVEAGVREGADYGSFNASNWIATGSSPTNFEKTMVEIQHRVCQSASTLPDYQTTDTGNLTCTNPEVTIDLEEGYLGADCSESPVTSGKLPCMVHVSAKYSFHPFFGGIGVGVISLPASVDFSRQTWFVVNDFPMTP